MIKSESMNNQKLGGRKKRDGGRERREWISNEEEQSKGRGRGKCTEERERAGEEKIKVKRWSKS